jgi:hypothetical protein
VNLARKANQTTGGANPIILQVLAAAYAQTGDFAEAIDTAKLSLQLVTSQNNTTLANVLRTEMEAYRKGLPLREGHDGNSAGVLSPKQGD